MDAKALLNERARRIDNVFEFKHNKQVVSGSDSSYWHVFDCGYTLNDLIGDYDRIENVVETFVNRYQYDIYPNYLPPIASMSVARKYGPYNMRVDENGEQIYQQDYTVMEKEEYSELTEDPDRFFWTKDVARKMPETFTASQMKEMVSELMKLNVLTAKVKDRFLNEFGALVRTKLGTSVPIENIFSFYRGIKQTSLDMRKCPEKIIALSDALFDRDVRPVLNMTPGIDHTGAAAALQFSLLAHSVMNIKQFEKFYWPYMKKIIDFCSAHHVRVWMRTEADILRFAEFFQEIPKGVVIA